MKNIYAVLQAENYPFDAVWIYKSSLNGLNIEF